MGRPKKSVVEARRREVAEYVERGDFSEAAINRLATAHGVTTRTIYLDAQKLRQSWAKYASATTIAEDREDWLRRVRENQRIARDTGQQHAVAKMLDLEAKVLGIFEPTRVEVDARQLVIQLTPEQIQERAAALMPELAALVEPIEGAEGDS